MWHVMMAPRHSGARTEVVLSVGAEDPRAGRVLSEGAEDPRGGRVLSEGAEDPRGGSGGVGGLWGEREEAGELPAG